MEWEVILQGRKSIGRYRHYLNDLTAGVKIEYNREKRVLFVECWSGVDGEDYEGQPERIERVELWQNASGEPASVALVRYALSIYDEWIAKIQAFYDAMPPATEEDKQKGEFFTLPF